MPDGKARLRGGYSRVANTLLVGLASAGLSGRELSVALFIIRQSYGWGRKWTDATTAMKLTEGMMSKSSVCLALTVLLERGIIKRDKDGRWSLNAHLDQWIDGEEPSKPLDGAEGTPEGSTVQISGRKRPKGWTPPVQASGRQSLGNAEKTSENPVPKENILKKERNTDTGSASETRTEAAPKGAFHVFMDSFLEECYGTDPKDPAQRAKTSAAYRRFGRAGKDVLAMADGDPVRALAAVHAIGYWLQNKGLSWTLDTVAQHALDYFADPKKFTEDRNARR